MARVIWSREAATKIISIRDYIGADDAIAAHKIAEKLLKAGESLTSFPNRGRPAAEGTRELPSVPPYVIVYEVVDDVAVILTIRHGRQKPRDR